MTILGPLANTRSDTGTPTKIHRAGGPLDLNESHEAIYINDAFYKDEVGLKPSRVLHHDPTKTAAVAKFEIYESSSDDELS